MASSIAGTRMSREDFKKAKELEELRKTGAAPPELDEDGKMINPHIPQYVSQAPWYLNQNRPGLKHQYTKHFGGGIQYDKLDKFHLRGARAPQKEASKKYRKGACENCGASTHSSKECVERPRRKGAKLTNNDIAADEHVHEKLTLDYDGKRDRWAGYDPATYKSVIQTFHKAEEERAKRRRTKVAEKMKAKEERRNRRKEKREAGEEASDDSDTDSDTEDEGENDEDEDEGENDEDEMDEDLLAARADDGQAFAKAMDNHKGGGRTTARNLRIREDTAKYLLNLDLKSAHYDPKTRSMRSNPHPNKDPNSVQFAGDNFVRHSGNVKDTAALQRFVWQANEKGGVEEVHMEATPSQAAALYKSYKEKLSSLKSEKKESILQKYGGEDHLNAPERELLLGESEAYVEYSQSGRVIKGLEAAIPSTKYAENILENNHTEIWGSYWNDQKWGYACCHQTLRNSYCTGAAGKQIAAAAPEAPKQIEAAPPAPAPTTAASSKPPAKPPVPLFNEPPADKGDKSDEGDGEGSSSSSSSSSSDDSSSSSDDSEDEGNSKKKSKKRKKKQKKTKSAKQAKPNPASADPSEAEMEEYRKTKSHWDDPIAKAHLSAEID
eukprot:g56563.t1